ncbi:ABC transporter ATP-binding protein [Peptostreptococcaceae bacterium AGR-M142]
MLIKGEKISKIYDMGEVKVKALFDADFEINKEEFLVILGPSGSGKSTLLNIIGGMDKLTSGTLTYNNKIISKLDAKNLTMYRRNNIGFVFQFYNLMPNLTAYENIELAHQIATDPLSIDEVLKDVGLYERKNHFPSQLSGGEQQRIALARALVKNPDVLLCDEPTGALDSKTSKEVLKILHKFLKKYKKTVIIITHNSEISKIANRVFYLKDGRIENIVKNQNPISIDEVVL